VQVHNHMIPACLDLTKFIHCEIHFLCRQNLASRKSAIIFDCEIYCCENLIKMVLLTCLLHKFIVLYLT